MKHAVEVLNLGHAVGDAIRYSVQRPVRLADVTTGKQVSVNSERGDPSSLFDLRISKALRFGTQRVDVFGEIFNLFDTANFGNRYNGNGLSPSFRQPNGLTLDVGYSRQLQLGARYTF